MMKDSKGKKIDDTFSLLEEQLITVMKYPEDQKSTITRILKFLRAISRRNGQLQVTNMIDSLKTMNNGSNQTSNYLIGL